MFDLYLTDVVAQALGTETPTPDKVRTATRTTADLDRFADRLLASYRKATLEPIPMKIDVASEFRPAFVNDFISSGTDRNPYSREFGFVLRALLYSHSVAVRDELAMWDIAEQSDRENWKFNLHMGFQDCPNGVWTALRILHYADYEQNNLVYYVPAPQKPSSQVVADEFPWSRVQDLVPLVAQTRGYLPTIVKPGMADQLGLLHRETTMMISEMQHALNVVGQLPQSVDLYVQDWFGGASLLGWLMRNSRFDPGHIPSKHSMAQSHILSSVIDLPTLDIESAANLSVDDLLRIRESNYFERFRTDVSEVLDDTSLERLTGDPMRAAHEQEKFNTKLAARRDTLVSSMNRSQLSSVFKATTRQGAIAASAAGVSALFGSTDLTLNAALATVGGIVGLPPVARAVARWLLTDKDSLAATDKLYRVFLAE